MSEIPSPPREFRGVWVATMANIDWPSQRGLPAPQQQNELRAIFDKAKALRLNAVIFQVRPMCDAFYVSSIEPWSVFLTGQQGKAPEPAYDPLEFAIQEAHKRGLELHAWFNPYRAGLVQNATFAPTHVSNTHPDLVKRYGKHLWLDPGQKAVQDYSLSVILDVAKRYDVDGIHFDDYFYPYREKDSAGKLLEFPDDASWSTYQSGGGNMSRDDWRRSNVDTLVERTASELKQLKPTLKFGISPFGIWRPNNPPGTVGMDAYQEIYVDSKKWLKSGWVDYIAPQLYWTLDTRGHDYGSLQKWWTDQNSANRHIWIGNYASSVSLGKWTADEIIKQITSTRNERGASGNIFFSAKPLLKNSDGLSDKLSSQLYQGPALIPACPWLDSKAPAAPRAEAQRDGGGNIVVTWKSGADQDVFLYAIYAHVNGAWRMDVVPGATSGYSINTAGGAQPGALAVSAVDRCGNESGRSVIPLMTQTASAR
ncbi:MAG: family 10 glycosylhydrolase [Candidatus Sumerlaeaceae bacterium]